MSPDMNMDPISALKNICYHVPSPVEKLIEMAQLAQFYTVYSINSTDLHWA